MSKLKMILLNGINPKAKLNLDWVDQKDSVMVCTAHNEEVIAMGRILLNSYNMTKLKPYRYAYLEKEGDSEWKPCEIDLIEIFRPQVINEELIKVSKREGGEIDEDEDMVF